MRTRIGTGEALRLADLPLKGHERLFSERVPLDPEQGARVRPSDPWDYGRLAEGVEAWGFRVMQERREYMDREEVARLWYEEEFLPVVEMLREGGFIRPSETEADAYTRVVSRALRAAAHARVERRHPRPPARRRAPWGRAAARGASSAGLGG